MTIAGLSRPQVMTHHWPSRSKTSISARMLVRRLVSLDPVKRPLKKYSLLLQEEAIMLRKAPSRDSRTRLQRMSLPHNSRSQTKARRKVARSMTPSITCSTSQKHHKSESHSKPRKLLRTRMPTNIQWVSSAMPVGLPLAMPTRPTCCIR